MRVAWVVLVIACASKHDKPPPPAPAAPAPAPVPHTKLVGCAPAQLPPRGERPDGVAPRRPAHVSDPKVWTPYAAGEGLAPNDIATAAATELETAIHAKLGKLDECIGDRTGSLRAVLFVAFDGGVITARVGGLGDHQVDACVAGALIGLKVGAPPIVSEVACDLSRGEPAPWRVTEDGYDTTLHVNGAAPSIDAAAEHAELVVVEADTAMASVGALIDSAPVRNATVIAVKIDAGPPVFLGVGFDSRTMQGGDGEPIAIDPRGYACADDDPIATGTPQQLVAALSARCKTDPCGTLAIPLGGTAREALATATAARDAGFSRILVGARSCDQSSSGSGTATSSGGSGTVMSSGGSAAGGNAPSMAKPSSR